MSGPSKLPEYDFQVGCVVTGRMVAESSKNVIMAIIAGMLNLPGVKDVEVYNADVRQRPWEEHDASSQSE